MPKVTTSPSSLLERGAKGGAYYNNTFDTAQDRTYGGLQYTATKTDGTVVTIGMYTDMLTGEQLSSDAVKEKMQNGEKPITYNINITKEGLISYMEQMGASEEDIAQLEQNYDLMVDEMVSQALSQEGAITEDLKTFYNNIIPEAETTFINSNFTGNHVENEQGEALGGAIYSRKNVKIAATDGKTSLISGNYTVSKDGKKFTTMFNPTGVTYRYKTSDKTRDAFINYMMNHTDEWMPSLGSNHNLSGVMFLDFDFDGVPELVAQKSDSKEYGFHSVVYKFEDGKLKRVGNVNDGFSIYYNKTAKKYEVHDLKISLNVDDGYYWSGNSIITYDGENLFANMYSSRGVVEESNNIYYRYFDGNDKNISRAKYNEINLKQFNNCVNAHMFTEFIATGYGDTSAWGEKTTAENKQSLLDAYNSFSYEKY